MKLGLHVSISGSIGNAVDNATKIGCTAFQMFTRNPRGWASKKLTKKDVDNFKKKLSRSKISKNAVCVHMPYLPNLSSPKKDSYDKSLDVLVDEVKRCNVLGIPYLVIHLGSHMGEGAEVGIKQLVNACNTAAKKADNKVTVLLENTAGRKNSIGSKFEELNNILEQLKPRRRFGICLDTCHAFTSGYDLRTKDGVDSTIGAFDEHIGMKELHVVHLNDSMGKLNSGIDRHYHIGLGHIGENGFRAFLSNKEIRKRILILETPNKEEDDDVKNLEKVKELLAS